MRRYKNKIALVKGDCRRKISVLQSPFFIHFYSGTACMAGLMPMWGESITGKGLLQKKESGICRQSMFL